MHTFYMNLKGHTRTTGSASYLGPDRHGPPSARCGQWWTTYLCLTTGSSEGLCCLEILTSPSQGEAIWLIALFWMYKLVLSRDENLVALLLYCECTNEFWAGMTILWLYYFILNVQTSFEQGWELCGFITLLWMYNVFTGEMKRRDSRHCCARSATPRRPSRTTPGSRPIGGSLSRRASWPASCSWLTPLSPWAWASTSQTSGPSSTTTCPKHSSRTFRSAN